MAEPQGADETDDYLLSDRGEFDVTISTGPSFQSQREMASDFADTILKEVSGLQQIPPQVTQKILAKAVKLKNVGPLGDEIHDLLDPPQDQEIPPQAQAQMAQMQGQLQVTQQELAKLQMERDAKVLENKHKFETEQMKEQFATDRQAKDIEAKILVAEIGAKAQVQSDREAFTSDEMKQLHVSAHEAATQAAEHSHQQDLADKAAANAQVQQATQISADQQAQQEQPTGAE
jgi:hypothetical protein